MSLGLTFLNGRLGAPDECMPPTNLQGQTNFQCQLKKSIIQSYLCRMHVTDFCNYSSVIVYYIN